MPELAGERLPRPQATPAAIADKARIPVLFSRLERNKVFPLLHARAPGSSVTTPGKASVRIALIPLKTQILANKPCRTAHHLALPGSPKDLTRGGGAWPYRIHICYLQSK